MDKNGQHGSAVHFKTEGNRKCDKYSCCHFWCKRYITSQERTRLAKFDGPATLTTAWAKSLLRRMNFTKRRGTTKSKLLVEEFHKLKASFLQEIVDIVTMEEIPPQLIFNWDQTGLNLVPVASWTMELKGSKRVEIKGLDDK